MNQQVLKLWLSVMFIVLNGTLTGCIHKPAVLEAYVHGPTIMKMSSQVDGKDGISLFVPRHSSKVHEVSPDMSTHESEKEGDCKVTFDFKLVGADPFVGQPRFASPSPIEPSPFRPVTFYVSKTWTVEDPFVRASFPSTPIIDFLDPLYPVCFKSGDSGAVPLTEILRYSVPNIKKLRMIKTRVTVCPNRGPATQIQYLRPMKCEEARKKYKSYSKLAHALAPEEITQRPFLQQRFASCTNNSYFYFLGVGLPPGTDLDTLRKHGRDFFNNYLLPAIFGPDGVPDGRRLLRIDGEVTPGAGPPVCNSDRAQFVPTVLKSAASQAHVVPIALTENCTAPGAMVIPILK